MTPITAPCGRHGYCHPLRAIKVALARWAYRGVRLDTAVVCGISEDRRWARAMGEPSEARARRGEMNP